MPLIYLIIIYSLEIELPTYHSCLVLAHSLQRIEGLSLSVVNLQDLADSALANGHLIDFKFLESLEPLLVVLIGHSNSLPRINGWC